MYQEFGASVLVPYDPQDMSRAIYLGRLRLQHEIERGLTEHAYRWSDFHDIHAWEREEPDGSVILLIKGQVGK